MIIWEGAELSYCINGEDFSIPLTNTQFAIISKILGLQLTNDGINVYSDKTLNQFLHMKGNPLTLTEKRSNS